MHPLARNLVIGLVGLIVAGGLAAVAVLGRDSSTSVLAMLGAGLVAAAVGIFMFVQGWIWSQRAYRDGYGGRSVAIALGGGLMIVLAAVALSATVILLLVFYAR
jgi:ABC-type sugar transport system substrate-binding protein